MMIDLPIEYLILDAEDKQSIFTALKSTRNWSSLGSKTSINSEMLTLIGHHKRTMMTLVR